MLRRNKPTGNKNHCAQCKCSAGGKCRTGLSEHGVQPPEETEADRAESDVPAGSNARSCYLRGLSHEKRGDFVRAIREYDSAIRLDPALAWAFYHRGISHGNIGNDRQQADDLKTAVRLGLLTALDGLATCGSACRHTRGEETS